MDLLRVTTAGSVDDGKSTLVGRLLHDANALFQDQLEAVERASRRRGEPYLNLALVTDGLRAEREQNVTIDVAYRYFATPRRKFIIADVPGHHQYTRNMVTGASTAELAVVLVDARHGVLTQSRRHGFLASLLGIPHVVVAVNKMDLVGYDRSVFQRIADEYGEFADKLEVDDLTMIPISALRGDNVVAKSGSMDWYEGATLLHHLETVKVGARRNLVDFRFPVQCAIRPHQDFRGYAGRVASGTVEPGEEVLVLPSRRATRIAGVHTPEGPQPEAIAGDSVVLTLEDDVDVARGDMIVRRRNLPIASTRLDAMLCWMSDEPLDADLRYALVHTTRETRAAVTDLVYRVDVDTLHRDKVPTLALNDIGRVEITTADPLFFDPYAKNAATGSFILIHPHTHETVAAGMIRGEAQPSRGEEARRMDGAGASPDVVWQGWSVPRERREARNGHRAAVLWFTGLSGSGKTTLATALEQELFARGFQTMLLDGDQLRHGLSGDLAFSATDRTENVRRAADVARLFFEQGSIVLCAFVSPYRADRDRARRLFPEGRFIEVHVDCDLDTLRQRDTKGLYERAEKGAVRNLTGVHAAYEPPTDPEVVLDSGSGDVTTQVSQLVSMLEERGLIGDGVGL